MAVRWLAILGVVAACGGGGGEAGDARAPDAPGADATTPCDDRGGEVRQLTMGDSDDEDGTFLVGDDGTLHFAFISDRGGTIDVWMISSPDALTWSAPRAGVATPQDDLLNVSTRTRDGIYHLTGRSGNAVAYVTSSDLATWSAPPTRWTDPAVLGRTAGTFLEDTAGVFWMVSISNRTGIYKLYLQRSIDRGASWSAPVPLTNHAEEDFLFSFRIAADGTFVLVWEQHAVGDTTGFTGDIFFATSPDAVSWTVPWQISVDPGESELDQWPGLITGPGGQLFAAWTTSRGPVLGGTIMIPVYPRLDLLDQRIVPGAGYSLRSQWFDGRYVMAWVGRDPANGSLDYFSRFACDFDFPPP